MRFKDLLQEKFKDGFIRRTYTRTGSDIVEQYVEVFENPTKQELLSIHKQSRRFELGRKYGAGGIRFFIQDKPNGKVYAWNGDVLHDTVRKELNIPGNYFGFYTENYSDDPVKIEADNMGAWQMFKNQGYFMDKMKEMFGNYLLYDFRN